MTVRRKRYSIFIFGEGSSEKAFLEHLKEIYRPEIDQHNKAISIEAGTGSSPKVILDDSIRVASSGEYRERYVVLDVDGRPPLSEEDRNAAQKASHILLESVPICFDCMLLKAKTGSNDNDCGRCKSKLAGLVSKPTDSNSYKKNFGREFLDPYFESHPNEPLSKIIRIFKLQS
jgi:hypothetical protein